jgi:hypothetical protein
MRVLARARPSRSRGRARWQSTSESKGAAKSSGSIKVPVGVGLETHFTILCNKSKGAGLIEGAKDGESFGTGKLTELSLSKCTVEGQPGCQLTGALRKIELKIETDGELLHPSTWTINVELIIDLHGRAKPNQTCTVEGSHELVGAVDSTGPHTQVTEFPSPPLASSSLTFDGQPAEFVGTYNLKAKGGPLSFG